MTNSLYHPIVQCRTPVFNPFFLTALPHRVEVDDDPRRSASAGVLILRDVKYADTAVYQCEATNVHGSILLNTYLYVIGMCTVRFPLGLFKRFMPPV